MSTKIHAAASLLGAYDLRRLENVRLDGAQAAHVGMVRIGAGTRSPTEGLRASARHEIAYLVQGRVRIDTQAESRVASAGDVIISSPAEPHATTALEDAVLFFVLVEPEVR